MSHGQGDSLKQILSNGKRSSLLRLRMMQSTVRSVTQKQDQFKVLESEVEFAPKRLYDELYPPCTEKHPIIFDNFGVSSSGSVTQMPSDLPLILSDFRRPSSLSLVKSSLQLHAFASDDSDNIFSAALPGGSFHEDQQPFLFSLPTSYDPNVLHVKPDRVMITLKETETFFLFEMPQLTVDLNTPEGLVVKEANERLVQNENGVSGKKFVDSETQTPLRYTKPRSTYIGHETLQSRGTYVNNWIMYDTFADPELVADKNEEEEDVKEVMMNKSGQEDSNEDTLAYIYNETNFRDAVRVMERIIASNVYINGQKRFKGLTYKNPYSLDLEFTYSLELLWVHSCPVTMERTVTCVKWNPVNTSLLGASYGSTPSENSGLFLIWCMKNPSQPDRIYRFATPVSNFDWSRNKPNQVALGFYDGTVKVIDVSKKNLVFLRQSSRSTSPSFSPHWQVQFWPEDEQFDYQENIYTSDQDGRIMRYRTGEDFSASEIMRIAKIEGEIVGVARTNYCCLYNIPLSRNPGVLVLRKHPEESSTYFVGTDEGCVHRCSTNYRHQQIDSFLAHDGPIYSLQFSPFCSSIFLTCGADWCTRIWVQGVNEPLITLSTHMACVRDAVWSPNNSTIIASIVNNEICIWDIKRKTYRPTSITTSPQSHLFVSINFTNNGKQLVAADANGDIYLYTLEGMPFPPLDQTNLLVTSIEKTLIPKPQLLRKLKKIGLP